MGSGLWPTPLELFGEDLLQSHNHNWKKLELAQDVLHFAIACEHLPYANPALRKYPNRIQFGPKAGPDPALLV